MWLSIKIVSSSKTDEACFFVKPVFSAICSIMALLVIGVFVTATFRAGVPFFVDPFLTGAFFFTALFAAMCSSF
jgi:hypothetical protein